VDEHDRHLLPRSVVSSGQFFTVPLLTLAVSSAVAGWRVTAARVCAGVPGLMAYSRQWPPTAYRPRITWLPPAVARTVPKRSSERNVACSTVTFVPAGKMGSLPGANRNPGTSKAASLDTDPLFSADCIAARSALGWVLPGDAAAAALPGLEVNARPAAEAATATPRVAARMSLARLLSLIGLSFRVIACDKW
jgi:hypothetical protein